MALNWDMTKVDDVEELHSSDYEWAITESVVLSTMMFDLGSISENNLDEWYFRIAIYQNLHGALMRVDGKPFYITAENIDRRIGLKVNVTDMARTKWLKKITDSSSIKDILASQVRSNNSIIEKKED
jgi:hypothetical protein